MKVVNNTCYTFYIIRKHLARICVPPGATASSQHGEVVLNSPKNFVLVAWSDIITTSVSESFIIYLNYCSNSVYKITLINRTQILATLPIPENATLVKGYNYQLRKYHNVSGYGLIDTSLNRFVAHAGSFWNKNTYNSHHLSFIDAPHEKLTCWRVGGHVWVKGEKITPMVCVSRD